MVPMKTDVFFNLTFYPIKLILDIFFFNFANKEMCLIINLLNASFMVYIGLDNHIFASQKELKLILINRPVKFQPDKQTHRYLLCY